jgi:hypothetical protein
LSEEGGLKVPEAVKPAHGWAQLGARHLCRDLDCGPGPYLDLDTHAGRRCDHDEVIASDGAGTDCGETADNCHQCASGDGHTHHHDVHAGDTRRDREHDRGVARRSLLEVSGGGTSWQEQTR